MKRPWQIAILFSSCLSVAAAAMAWLSLKALELDRAEALAQQQAKQEENVNLALWRGDTLFMPLLAQEATRPPSLFQAFSGANGENGGPAPSPLLHHLPELVQLHFQVTSANEWTSPQIPEGTPRAGALPSEPSASAAFESRAALLEVLRSGIDFATLLRQTPPEMLPSFDQDGTDWNNAAWERQLAAGPIVSNAYGFEAAAETPDPVLATTARQEGATLGSRATPPDELSQSRVGGKGQNDLVQRNRAFQTYAQQQAIGQRANTVQAAPRSLAVSEGVSRAFWVDGKLLLARRVQKGEELAIQGCWLDWRAMERRLREETSDLLPHAQFVPVSEDPRGAPNRLMATLPVQIVVPPPDAEPRPWSPIRLSLAIAWSCLTIAALALAGLLWGVVSLSERRAAFVAAVTHELRTPLTTFRLYTEMLAHDMAPIEKRREYLETLHAEANRLTHLVENVLTYACLERGRNGARKGEIPLAELVEQWAPVLADRAAQAGLELVVFTEESARTAAVLTDPQAVGQILFNLVDNAAKYAAQAQPRRVELKCWTGGATAYLRVRDFGPGLSNSGRRRLFRPFSKTVQEAAVTAPGVGLGLALCRRLATALGGKLRRERALGQGAAFVLELPAAVPQGPPPLPISI